MLVLLSVCLCAHSADKIIKFCAQAYTPEVVTGDNPRPLHEFSRIAREWEKMHPGVKIQFVRQPVGDYLTWLITQLKGGMAPDIVWADSSWCNQYAKYGWFADLDQYLQEPNKYAPRNKRWLDIFYTHYVDFNRAPDRKLYTLPIDLVETGVYYNKDIFRNADVEPPKTWAEFMNVCEKIQKTGHLPFLMQSGKGGPLDWCGWALHDQLWRDVLPAADVGGKNLVEPQEVVRAYKKGIWSVKDPRYEETLRILKEWAQYWNKDGISAVTGNERLFTTGKAAMYLSGSWYLPDLIRDPYRTFDFGIFPLPRLTKETSKYAPADSEQAPGIGGPSGIQYAITNSAERDDKLGLAVDFMQFFTAPQNLGPLVAEAEICIPNGPEIPVNPVMKPFVEQLKARRLTFTGQLTDRQYYDHFFRVLQSYLGGHYSLDQAIEGLDNAMGPAIDRMIKDNPQWNFDSEWGILPDKTAFQVQQQIRNPPFLKYIPWAFLGALIIGPVAVNVMNRKEVQSKGV